MTEQTPGKQASILVVDDEHGVREMFKALLGVSGYKVYTQPSGAEAIAFLSKVAQQLDGESPVSIDLVILDVLMPGMSGHELCQWIKTQPLLKYVPVLMVTALGSLQDRIEGVDIGADDYIAKPFRTEELLVRVRALLRIGHVQRELLERNLELRTLRSFNQNVLEHMGNGLLTVDAEQKITFLNPPAARLLNCPAEEWVGRSLSQLPSSYSPLIALIERCLAEVKPLFYREVGIAYDQGREVPLRVNTTLLYDGEGSMNGAVCILEDLSELRAMEEEQRRLDRLAALGQMAATVAHEIRNPLLTLSLGIQFLERKLGGNGTYDDTLDRLNHQVDRLTQIMNEFLAFSRPRQVEFEAVDAIAFLDRIIDGTEAHFTSRDMTVVRQYDASPIQTYLDPEHMERAFTNLILNAADAMEAGGTLAVRARAMSGQETSPSAGQDLVVFEFQDTGAGIEPDALGHIFEPFYTTKPKGTGLGLAITQRVVQEHGGKIGVRSEVGRGTTFTISLPRRI